MPRKWNQSTGTCHYYYIWKIDIKPKLFRRDKGLFILTKATIHTEDIIILNIHTLNMWGVPNFIKQIPLDIKSRIIPTLW